MDVTKAATDLGSSAASTSPPAAADASGEHLQHLALIILTGQTAGGSEWLLLNQRLRDLARALEAGDATGAGLALGSARDALACLRRATTQATADADAIRIALDRVATLLPEAPSPADSTHDARIAPT